MLVVEDDRRIRDLLGRFLKDQGYRVTLAASAEEARGLLAGLAFDLMVLDIMLPGESGLELTRSLRQADDVPIILLTARGEPEDRIRGLEHGADDYLAKPFEPMELLLRVKSILKRTFTEDTDEDEEVRLGQCRYDPVRGELMRDDESIKLTSGENMLLRLFAQNPGKTFSRLDLCQELGVPQERSIDVQVTRLRRKIEDDPKAPLYLQTVRGIVYVLIPG
ncbi:MAG: response regulator [Pseudomonadota bacterium]